MWEFKRMIFYTVRAEKKKQFQCLEVQYRKNYLKQQLCRIYLHLFTVWSEIMKEFELNFYIVLFGKHFFILKETSGFCDKQVRLLWEQLGVLVVKKNSANIMKWEKVRCNCSDITAASKELKGSKELRAVTQEIKCSLLL